MTGGLLGLHILSGSGGETLRPVDLPGGSDRMVRDRRYGAAYVNPGPQVYKVVTRVC